MASRSRHYTTLLSTTFLASLAGFTLLAPDRAQAVCDDNFVEANNQVINCDANGVDNTGISNNGAANTTTVNMQDGASITLNNNANGVDLLANSTLNMFGNASINTNNGYGAYFIGDNSVVTLNDMASIVSQNSDGVDIFGDNTQITLNDNSSIQSALFGFYLIGNNSTFTLNGSASIDASTGISFNGNNNTLTIGSAASVVSSGFAINFGNGSSTLTNFGTLTSQGGSAFSGDINAGNSDTINNFGVITGGNGTAINLFNGNDFLTLGTGSAITGDIDGGLDDDLVTLIGSGSEDDDFVSFETLVMNGDDWSLSGTSDFALGIQIQNGRLAINGNVSTPPVGTAVFPNGILSGTGTLTSPVTSNGTIAPGNGVGTLNVIGDVFQDGFFGHGFDIEFDNSDLDLLNIGGQLNLTHNPLVNVIPLNGAGGAEGIIVQTTAAIVGDIGATTYQGNGGATVFKDGNNLRLIAFDGTGTVAGNVAGLRGAMDYLDAVAGAQLYDDTRDDGREARIWGRGFGHFTAEDAREGNQAYDTRTAGSAVGGDFELLEGLRLGLSGGYGSTDADVARNAANAEIDGEYAALYARYELGGFFVSGVMSGGLQQVELDRSVATRTGRQEAEGETDSVVYGGSLHAGYDFDFGEGFRLTPSAGVLYQHQRVDGYKESGTGRGDVTMKDQKSEAIRLTGQVNLAKTIDFEGFELTPHVSAGIANEITKGGKARGTFSNGSAFEVQLQEDNQVMGLAGAGLSIGFDTGLALSLDYQSRIAGDTTNHGILAGVAFKW